jgi:transmembrane sensor
MTHDSRVEAAALDWVLRQRDPAFEQWEDFADWMAQDPAHQQAYYELAALDAELVDLPVTPEPAANDDPADANVVPFAPRRVNRRAWLTGAIAASLVGMVSIGLLNRPSDSYRIETAMGETQEVKLADGSRIAVNGGSSILLSHADPRKAVLERGQVLFHVVHREDAPFRVTAGEAELIDIGTVFDVTRTDGRTVVAVSEGAVVYNPAKDNVRVDPGRRLVARDNGAVRLGAVNPEAVGGWEHGQLVYDGVPLGEVVAEIGRTTGIRLRTTPATASITFRGALQTSTNEASLVDDLAALSGTRATQDSGGWTLSK